MIQKICDHHKVSHKTLYHYVLNQLQRKFDLNAAREIYHADRGVYPQYAIDIVSYFPILSDIATHILHLMESEIDSQKAAKD